MPHTGDHLSPPLTPPDLLAPKSIWRRGYLKSEPALVGGAWFVTVQVIGAVAQKAGYSFDPELVRDISIGAGAVTFLFSYSQTVTLGIRLVLLRFYSLLRLIDDRSYTQMKKAIQDAFVERVAR